MPTPYPANEAARLLALRDLGILDSPPDAEFDAIVQAAALACGVPTCLITLIDEDRQWIKANFGLPGLIETPRGVALCAHTILGADIMEVPDAREDGRFKDNPLVTGTPDIRFYAGVPVSIGNGSNVGALCLIDREPRRLSGSQREILRLFGVAAGKALIGWRARRELQQITHALQSEHERMDNVLGATGAGTWELDVQTGELLVNERYAHLLGWSLAELSPVSTARMRGLIHPDDLAGSRARLLLHLDGSCEHFEDEIRMRHRNGHFLWMFTHGTVMLRDAAGKAERMFGTMLDVTERVRQDCEREERRRELSAVNAELETASGHLRAARDEADRASRAKSRFVAAMSHELRTPLNGVLGHAQLLRLEGGLTETQGVRVSAMLSAGAHLLDMIGSALALSEIESEHVQLRPVRIDLAAEASASVDLVRGAAELKGLSLGLAAGGEADLRLVADPLRLRQVLLNLLGNAVKFTERGGVELRVRTLVGGVAVRLEVADTGPGISPDMRGRLFRDFERLQPDTTEGAGLGLALSARLALLMGGRLGFDANPAGGSIFWLELPLDQAAGPEPEAAPPAPDVIAVAAPAGLRILVVDDIEMNRDITCAFLRMAGHTPTCAAGGAAAVAFVMDHDFDVVLMDVRMPDVDGLEATRRIRALRGAAGKVAIVGLTAHAFPDQVLACTQAGMDGHLAKPYTPEALSAEIVSALAVRRDGRPGFAWLAGLPAQRATDSMMAGDGKRPRVLKEG